MSNDTLTTNITNTLIRAPVHNNIRFFNAGMEVLRISEKGVTANPDVPVDEAAAAVIAALNTMLPIKRPWVGLTDEDLEFWTEELGQGELGRGVLRAVADHLKEKNT
jgi:hypothetical protein